MTRLADTQFLVVDTETTGIDPATCKVVELAYVLTNLTGPLAAGSFLVNPGCPIPPEASAVHHLVDEDVVGEPSLEEVLKIPADVVESRFGYMLKEFTYGAPPHGGIAFGLDRIAALLCGTTSIRDVIAFPKTQKGQDLMAQSPTPVTPRQLKELHIATVLPAAD